MALFRPDIAVADHLLPSDCILASGRLQFRVWERFIGLSLAMLTRIGLLLSLAWIMTLTEPLFSILGEEVSGRDPILAGLRLFAD